MQCIMRKKVDSFIFCFLRVLWFCWHSGIQSLSPTLLYLVLIGLFQWTDDIVTSLLLTFTQFSGNCPSQCWQCACDRRQRTSCKMACSYEPSIKPASWKWYQCLSASSISLCRINLIPSFFKPRCFILWLSKNSKWFYNISEVFPEIN